MSMETCTGHDDVVVVYDGHGYRHTQCPLCEAEAAIKELEDKVEESAFDIDTLKDDVAELHSELEAAEPTGLPRAERRRAQFGRK